LAEKLPVDRALHADGAAVLDQGIHPAGWDGRPIARREATIFVGKQHGASNLDGDGSRGRPDLTRHLAKAERSGLAGVERLTHGQRA
jgi:hypothetical protein